MEWILWAVAGTVGAYLTAVVTIPTGIVAVVVEELAKLGVLTGGREWLGRVGWKQGVVVGLFFGLTELVLYSAQLWEMGAMTTWGERAMWTVPMHALTGGMLGWSKWGILGAVVTHGVFNYLLG